jgi:hypothetical protein
MNDHELKLNGSKTEFIVYGKKTSLQTADPTQLRVGDAVIMPKKSVRNIGFVLDCSLSAEDQVNHVCWVSYLQLKNLSRLKKYMNRKCLEKLIHAFITSRIDFCNSLYFGLNARLLSKLQILQNSCARFLCGVKRVDHITPVLKDLHWLPVEQRIVFKVLVLIFKCLYDPDFPAYLASSISLHVPRFNPARSPNTFLLDVPFTRLSYLQNTAFTHFAPLLWNRLPLHLRSIQSLSVFKSHLKTHLFILSFH